MDQLKSLLSKKDMPKAAALARSLEQHDEFAAAAANTKAIITATMILAEIHDGTLEGAKFVWRRAGADVKALRDVETCWELAKLLWLSNSAGFFAAAAAAEASASVKRGIAATAESVRERLLKEIGEAYSTISLASLATAIGMGESDARDLASARGWTLDRKTLRQSAGGAITASTGAGSSSASSAAAPSASQGPAVALSTLRKLTSYVSSLEKAPLVPDAESAAVAALVTATSGDTGAAAASSSSSSSYGESKHDA